MCQTKFHIHVKREKLKLFSFVCMCFDVKQDKRFWIEWSQSLPEFGLFLILSCARFWSVESFLYTVTYPYFKRCVSVLTPSVTELGCLTTWFWRCVNEYQVITCRIYQCIQEELKWLLDGCGRNGSTSEPSPWMRHDADECCEDPVSQQITAAAVSPCGTA